MRILTAYFLVNGMWFLVQDFVLNQHGLGAFLLDITSLNFWINGRLTTGHLYSLILIQLLTPCYLRLREGYPVFQICCIAAFYFAATAICHFPGFGRAAGHLLVFIFRIPVYLIGLAIWKANRRCRDYSGKRVSGVGGKSGLHCCDYPGIRIFPHRHTLVAEICRIHAACNHAVFPGGPDS